MSDKRSDTYRAEALRLLEAARKATDRTSRIELIRLAATFHEIAGGSPIDVDALLVQYSQQPIREQPTQPAVLQQQQTQPKKSED